VANRAVTTCNGRWLCPNSRCCRRIRQTWMGAKSAVGCRLRPCLPRRSARWSLPFDARDAPRGCAAGRSDYFLLALIRVGVRVLNSVLRREATLRRPDRTELIAPQHFDAPAFSGPRPTPSLVAPAAGRLNRSFAPSPLLGLKETANPTAGPAARAAAWCSASDPTDIISSRPRPAPRTPAAADLRSDRSR
jgi:hypothetical protein